MTYTKGQLRRVTKGPIYKGVDIDERNQQR